MWIYTRGVEPFVWTTYAERLQRAGIAWQVYQEGLDEIDDDPMTGNFHCPGDCGLEVTAMAAPRGNIRVRLRNGDDRARTITLRDASYGRGEQSVGLAAGGTQELLWDLQASHHWYDLIISTGQHQWRLAGHVEDGCESVSDPANVAPVLT